MRAIGEIILRQRASGTLVRAMFVNLHLMIFADFTMPNILFMLIIEHGECMAEDVLQLFPQII